MRLYGQPPIPGDTSTHNGYSISIIQRIIRERRCVAAMGMGNDLDVRNPQVPSRAGRRVGQIRQPRQKMVSVSTRINIPSPFIPL